MMRPEYGTRIEHKMWWCSLGFWINYPTYIVAKLFTTPVPTVPWVLVEVQPPRQSPSQPWRIRP